jgi:putative Mg2+ transporter-C (MgtC) family protein
VVITSVDFSVRLGVALVLGGAIGIERQWRQTRAVLKTNALVCIGAAMFVMLSVMTPGDSSPTRVAAQVVSGVGFLGGGVILREGASIRGLNTAATLWCSAAVGTLAGSGLMFQAYIGAFAVVITNLLLRPLVEQIKDPTPSERNAQTRYRCSVVCNSKDESRVRSLLLQVVNDKNLMLDALQSSEQDPDIAIDEPNELEATEVKTEIEADFVTAKRNDKLLDQIINRLKTEGQVNSARWEIVTENS